ncbi:MAG: RagB/SusD family nutrient uptake outer membrane protein [bacterium]
MKKIMLAVSVLISSVWMLSCSEDFTLLAPQSDRNVENFYKNAKDFEVAVNGIYDALQSGGTYGNTVAIATGGTGGYWMLTEMRSDNTDQGGDVTGLAAQVAVINQFAEDALNEFVLGAWVGSYAGIARANIVLTRIVDVDMDQSLKDRYTGEALFLRSLFYYNLALLFGNIPMPLTETVSISDQLEQVPAATVFNQLIADLKEAQAKLPDVHTSAVGGKATRGAAQTLLARVYLTVGDKASAETVLRDIISSGLYQLVPNYEDLWGPENENNIESIFEVQFKAGGFGEGSGYANSFSPSSDLVGGGPTGGRNRPTLDMIAAYETNDLRFLASMDTSYVDLSGTTNSARYVKKYLSVPFGDNDADNNFIVFRYADVLLMLAEAIGEGAEAYGLINQLRSRAGLADIDASTPGTFEDKLLHERRVELAFENHRWYDLLRFGKALEVMQAHMAAEGFPQPGVNDLLFPIPQREVDLGLQQNPGY